jgi:hypothetical protein
MCEIRLGRKLKRRKTPKISSDVAMSVTIDNASRCELLRGMIGLSLQLILNC